MNYKKFYKNNECYSREKRTVTELAMRAKYDGAGNEIIDTYAPRSIVELHRLTDTCNYHNSIYRGKDVTDRFLAGDIANDCDKCNIRDLFIGDYFSFKFPRINNNQNMRQITLIVAHFEKWNNQIVIITIPKDNILEDYVKWNSTSTVEGGYTDSLLHSKLQDIAYYINMGLHATNAGLSIATYDWRFSLSDLVMSTIKSGNGTNENGMVASASNINNVRGIIAPSETELYGSRIWSSSLYDNYNTEHMQLALYKLNRTLLKKHYGWTRSIHSNTKVCISYSMPSYDSYSSWDAGKSFRNPTDTLPCHPLIYLS